MNNLIFWQMYLWNRASQNLFNKRIENLSKWGFVANIGKIALVFPDIERNGP